MNLQELLGDAYNENMTLEDVQNALQGKNLVDLSTGNYVDVNKYNREITDLQNTITKKEQELQKNTQNANSQSTQNEQLISSLQEQITQLNIENNKSSATASMSEARTLLAIADTDNDYTTFINNVSVLDKDVSNSIASYFGKQIKAAYDKGVQDANKDNLGSMGKQKGSSGSSDNKSNNFGRELAKKTMSNSTTVDYFKRD